VDKWPKIEPQHVFQPSFQLSLFGWLEIWPKIMGLSHSPLKI